MVWRLCGTCRTSRDRTYPLARLPWNDDRGKDHHPGGLDASCLPLRSLGKGQTVNFMIPAADKAYMINLKEHFGEEIAADADLSLDQLIRYALLNQVIKESGNNYRAIKERMKVALMSRVLAVMWNDDTTPDQAFRIYEQTRSMFVKELPPEAWEQWGRPTRQKPTPAALQEMLTSWKANPIVKSIQDNPSLYPGLDVNDLFSEWEGIISGDNGPLPPKVSTAASYGNTVEKLSEQQQQQQAQNQQQQQQQQQVHTKLKFDPEKITVQHHKSNSEPFAEREMTPMTLNQAQRLTDQETWLVDTFQTRNVSPSITANDMVRSSEDLSRFSDMFDNDLLVTLNYAPVYLRHRTKWGGGWDDEDEESVEPPKKGDGYVPFDVFQVASTTVEVMVNDETGQLKVKLLDNADADDVSRAIDTELAAARRPDVPKSKMRIGLIHLQNDQLEFDREGSQGISLADPKTRERVLELTVQAKFAAGFLEYREEEIPYLRKWLEKVGSQRAFDLMNRILDPVGKGDSRRRFAGSTLAKELVRLGMPPGALAL